MADRRRLTDAQDRVLDALERLTADGWPATVRDVCRELGFASPSTAHHHLHALERAGFARQHPRNRGGGWKPTNADVSA